VLEEIVGLNAPTSIRALFESYGLQIQEWDKVKTDHLTISEIPLNAQANAATLQEARHV
jgi:hypothetical protein